jgi:hypothetical protein
VDYLSRRIRGEYEGTENVPGSSGADLDDINNTLTRIELEIG